MAEYAYKIDPGGGARGAQEPQRARPKRFTRFLQGSYDHYTAILSHRFSWFYRQAFRFLFNAHHLDEGDIRAIRAASKKGPLLYVARDMSRLEYLAFAWVLRKHELPPPSFAHYLSMTWHIPFTQLLRRWLSVGLHYFVHRAYPNPYRNGYLFQLMESRTPSLLFVSHFRGLPRRFGLAETDVLTEIFRIQRKIDHPIQVVPLVLIYGRKPDRDVESLVDLFFGPIANPGGLRRLWMAIRCRREARLCVGEIDSLENRVAQLGRRSVPGFDPSAELAYRLRRELITELDEERRVVLGPIQKVRSEIIEAALHNSELTRYIRRYCKENNKSLVETRARARRYLEEMAADYRPATVALASKAIRWWLQWGRGRIQVEAEGLDRVRRVARHMPLVYVPCHKSHMDYLLVSYVLYQNHLSLPRVLGGINLNFPPVGGVFRQCGAFFLRRAFRGKRVYSRAVAAYVETLLREKINLEFFVEGGRSRIGKIIPPKLGFISIILEAFRRSGGKDLAFVPVTIDYERIFEEKFFLEEAGDAGGGANKLKLLIRNRRLMRRRIGEIAITFGEPFSLTGLLAESGMPGVPTERRAQMALSADLAYKITWAINQRTQARPYAILATVLLVNPGRGILLPEMEKQVHLLVEFLHSRGVNIAGTLWKEPNWVRLLLDYAVREKAVRVEPGDDGDEDTIVFLDEDRRMPLTIHRNSILHFYQNLALLSVVYRSAGGPKPTDEVFRCFRIVKEILAAEMIYAPRYRQSLEEDKEMFRRAREYFSGKGFLVASEQGEVLTADGMKAARLFASILVAFLESYYVVARTLWKHRAKTMSDKEWVKRAMKKGRFLLGLGEIHYPEAVHKLHFETALRHFSRMGLCRMEEKVKEKSRVERSLEVRDLPALGKTLADIRESIRR